jgi:hypothetical protein
MKRIYYLIISLLLLTMGYGSIQAQDDVSPAVIEVGLYVIGTSEFNLDIGTYNIDFFITMHCSVECTDDMVSFDVVGINSTESLQVETRKQQGNYAEFRVQAILNNNDINLRRYPFDNHRLNVMIESKSLLTDALIYKVKENETGIDDDVRLQGWNLDSEYTVKVVEKSYFSADEERSRIILTMETNRVPTAAFIRSILPAMVIIIISFVGTLVPDRYQRIGLLGGVLLAMLLHHLGVGSEIPPVEYPVYFDAFMLLNDIAILIQFVGTVYELIREKRGTQDHVLDFLNYKMLVLHILVWIILQIGTYLSFFT